MANPENFSCSGFPQSTPIFLNRIISQIIYDFPLFFTGGRGGVFWLALYMPLKTRILTPANWSYPLHTWNINDTSFCEALSGFAKLVSLMANCRWVEVIHSMDIAFLKTSLCEAISGFAKLLSLEGNCRVCYYCLDPLWWWYSPFLLQFARLFLALQSTKSQLSIAPLGFAMLPIHPQFFHNFYVSRLLPG